MNKSSWLDELVFLVCFLLAPVVTVSFLAWYMLT